jgi:hypothetical protein
MEEDVPRTKECVTCGRVASGGLVGVRKFEKPASASRRFRQSHAQDTTFKYAPFPLSLPSWFLSCFSRGARDRWTHQAPLTLRTRAKSRLAHASKTLKLPRLKSGLDADAGHQAQKGASACCLHRRAPRKQQASFLASDVHSRIVVPVRLPYAFFSAHIICLPGAITLSLSSLCPCPPSCVTAQHRSFRFSTIAMHFSS